MRQAGAGADTWGEVDCVRISEEYARRTREYPSLKRRKVDVSVSQIRNPRPRSVENRTRRSLVVFIDKRDSRVIGNGKTIGKHKTRKSITQ